MTEDDCKALREQAWSTLSGVIADIDRIAEYGPAATENDQKLIRAVFLAVSAELGYRKLVPGRTEELLRVLAEHGIIEAECACCKAKYWTESEAGRCEQCVMGCFKPKDRDEWVRGPHCPLHKRTGE